MLQPTIRSQYLVTALGKSEESWAINVVLVETAEDSLPNETIE